MATVAKARNGGRGTMGARVVSIVAWCVGVWTTAQFLTPMVGEGPGTVLAAFIAQALLTAGESPIWRGQGTWWNVLVLVIDDVTNIGGFFVYLLRIDQTDSWAAFNQAFETSSTMNPLTALTVSIVFGVLVAAAPEYLWREK